MIASVNAAIYGRFGHYDTLLDIKLFDVTFYPHNYRKTMLA